MFVFERWIANPESCQFGKRFRNHVNYFQFTISFEFKVGNRWTMWNVRHWNTIRSPEKWEMSHWTTLWDPLFSDLMDVKLRQDWVSRFWKPESHSGQTENWAVFGTPCAVGVQSGMAVIAMTAITIVEWPGPSQNPISRIMGHAFTRFQKRSIPRPVWTVRNGKGREIGCRRLILEHDRWLTWVTNSRLSSSMEKLQSVSDVSKEREARGARASFMTGVGNGKDSYGQEGSRHTVTVVAMEVVVCGRSEFVYCQVSETCGGKNLESRCIHFIGPNRRWAQLETLKIGQ